MSEIAQELETVQKETYVFVVHGFAPELWNGTAFRVSGRIASTRRRVIKCPYCGKHLISVAIETRIEIHRAPRTERQIYHEYKTCRACHERVGIIFA